MLKQKSKQRRLGSKAHVERPTKDQDYLPDPDFYREWEKKRTVKYCRVIRKSIPGH